MNDPIQLNQFMIKKYFYFAIVVLITSSFTTEIEKECRNSSFGATIQTVKLNETAIFVKQENILHNLKSLTFVDYGVEANYIYTYTFHSEKLTGLQIKKTSISGDNSFMNAADDYNTVIDKYNLNCKIKIKEAVSDQGLKSFKLTSPKREIYVMVVRENQDFFLVEKIFKK